MSQISARSQHPNADEAQQENLKNFKQEVVTKLGQDIDLTKVDVWFQDETGVG